MDSRGKRSRRAPKRLADEQSNDLMRGKEKKNGSAPTKAVSKPSIPTPSTNAARGKLLKKELAKYKLTRRKDSKLCDAYIKGTTTKNVDEVVLTMCRMKFLYEGYCKKFNEEVDRIDTEIDEEVEHLAEMERRHKLDPFSQYEGYYRGIRGVACEAVTGFYSFLDVKSDIANGWTDFPDDWPWMK